MPFLDYFRCCCCKKKPTPLPPPIIAPTHIHHPTMVSFNLERTSGIRRAFDALPEVKETPRSAPFVD